MAIIYWGMSDSMDKLIFRELPTYLLEIMRKYFRLQVEGAEHLPKRGPAIIAPNHSGVSGFDALVLMHEIERITGRLPRVMTHHFWFLTKTTSIPAKKLGFIDATSRNGLRELEKKQMIMLFPEGEYGNFKPSTKAYQLQEFKRGFVRMAIKTGAPIIPTMIIGAEEANINLSQFKLTKFLRGVVIPLPLNIIPLPSKWKIKFLKPIYLPYKPSAVNDRELMRDIADDIREQIQSRIQAEIKKRKNVYF
ncbi:MAG: acyltransferase family protein [Bdellovibrionales bacterium]|nr:acyltransferase family protein [Bdellovibrionales bacterium]